MRADSTVEWAVSALLLVGLGMLISTHELQSASERSVSGSQQLVHSSELVLSLAKDIEAAKRGYLLTSNPADLEPYRQAVEQLPGALNRLRHLVTRSPESKEHLSRIVELIDRKKEWAADVIRAHDSVEKSRAKELYESGAGKSIMDALRREVADLQQHEFEYLVKRESETVRAKRWTRGIALLLVLASWIGFMWASHQARQEQRKQEAASAMLRERNAELLEAKEKAEHATNARSRMIAMVSHDIRTPLSGIAGMSRLLIGDETEPANREFAEAICTCAESLLVLLNDVLDVSKLEADKLELNGEAFNLLSTCRNICSVLGGPAASQGVSLSLEYADGLGEVFYGDAHRVRQIISNVVSNAVKFTPKGSVRCIVTALTEVGDGVRIAVMDTGIGIAPEKLPMLFDAYEQGSVDTAARYGGSGLGLWITKKLTKLMGGEVTVESTEGKGTTFSLELPLRKANNAGKGRDEMSAELPAFPELHVLVAEDDKVNQVLCKRLLEKLGAVVDLVPNGKQAVEACGRAQYDLILMDCNMPEVDGYAATRMLRCTQTNGDVRIVAITADTTSEARQKCLESGMDDCLIKPANIESLVNLLSTIQAGDDGLRSEADRAARRKLV